MPDTPAGDEPTADEPTSSPEPTPAAGDAAVADDAPPVVTDVVPEEPSREVSPWKLVAVIAAIVVVLGGGALAYHYRGKIFKSSSSNSNASTTPATPIPKIEDTFDRADSTDKLGTTSSGQPWHVVVGTWGVTGKQAYVSAQNPSGPRNIAFVDTGSGDGSVSAKAPTLVDGWGLVFRYQNPGAYWRVYWNAQFKALHVIKYQDNKEVEAIPGGFLAPTAKDGMELRVEYLGSNITVFVNNVPLRTISDSYLQTQTKDGMYVGKEGQPTARWAAFVATSGAPDTVRTAPPFTGGANRTGGSAPGTTGGGGSDANDSTGSSSG